METSHFRTDGKKWQAYETVKLRLINLYKSESYKIAAYEISVMEKYLRLLLPNPKNFSYKTSVETLDNILAECKQAQKGVLSWTI